MIEVYKLTIAVSPPFLNVDAADIASQDAPQAKDGQLEAAAGPNENSAPPRYQAIQNSGATRKKTSTSEKKWKRKSKSKYAEVQAVVGKMQDAADKLNEWEETKPEESPLQVLSNGLYFNSAKEANALDMITYWDPPKDDLTIPTTQEARVAVVKKLVANIKNNKNCLTLGEDGKAFMNRWGDKASFFKESALEAVAWNVLVSSSCSPKQYVLIKIANGD